MSIETEKLGKSQADRQYKAEQQSAAKLSTEMSRALSELRAAAITKKPDEICAAYQALRSSANGVTIGELLHTAGKTLGGDPTQLIISAYSHRNCFMCKEGTVKCSQCEGSGEMEEDRPCARCDGIGVVTCGFCGGTGWSDRTATPHELASAVANHQLAMTRSDLNRLGKVAARLTPQKMASLEADQRKSVGAWMMRLQARLLELAQASEIKQSQATQLRDAADTISACTDILRRY